MKQELCAGLYWGFAAPFAVRIAGGPSEAVLFPASHAGDHAKYMLTAGCREWLTGETGDSAYLHPEQKATII